MQKNKVVIYARSATNNSANINFQIHRCLQYAKDNNLEVEEVFTDEVTSKDYVLSGFNKLLTKAKSKKIENFLTLDDTRLSRYSSQRVILEGKIKALKMKIMYVQEANIDFRILSLLSKKC